MYEEPFTVERGRAALTAILSALENQVHLVEFSLLLKKPSPSTFLFKRNHIEELYFHMKGP